MAYKFFTSLKVRFLGILIKGKGEFNIIVRVKKDDIDKVRELIDNTLKNGEYTVQIFKE